MTWNLDSALITTFTLVRDNFMAFFAVTLLFTAPTLLIGFVDDEFAVTLVVGVIRQSPADREHHHRRAAGAGRRAARAAAVLLQQINRPDFGMLLVLGVVQHFVIMLGLISSSRPGLYVLASGWWPCPPSSSSDRRRRGAQSQHGSHALPAPADSRRVLAVGAHLRPWAPSSSSCCWATARSRTSSSGSTPPSRPPSCSRCRRSSTCCCARRRRA